MGQEQSRFLKRIGPRSSRKLRTMSHDEGEDNPTKETSLPPQPCQSSPQSSLIENATLSSSPGSSSAINVGEMTKTRETVEEKAPSNRPSQPVLELDQPMLDQPMPDQPTEDAVLADVDEPAANQPPMKREYTPAPRIEILTTRAWRAENIYGNVHVHVTRTLNRTREQQMRSSRRGAAARQEKVIYQAADRCTLALTYLVDHFSTGFFDHAGPEKIVSMMTTIEADASALDELRPKQRALANYGYNMERKLVEMERHILDLAEVARRIRDVDCSSHMGDEDADGETDPDYVS